MRCFCEVLGVEKTADAAELKRGYYKSSIIWHPDKNQDRAEEATLRFQEIMEAYRVLSDAQERAWYDRHRDDILRGGQGGIGGQYKEERLDVFQFFTRSCYNKFDDEPDGFFTVYRKVFEDIAAEERRASDKYSDSTSEEDDGEGNTNPKKNKSGSFPTFGKMDSSYEDVVQPFYAWWEAFVSWKSYAWLEPHNTRNLSCRAERRAAEAENRKHREAARKTRNEEVRQLVAYVQRRDKRIAVEQERIAQANLELIAKTKKYSKKARDRNKIQLEAAWMDEMTSGGLASKWAEDLEAELGRLEAEIEGRNFPLGTHGNKSYMNGKKLDQSDDEDENEDSEIEEELCCIACNKCFTNLASKQNHEASKKHKKAVALLRLILMEQELLAKLEEVDEEDPDDVDEEEDEEFANDEECDADELPNDSEKSELIENLDNREESQEDSGEKVVDENPKTTMEQQSKPERVEVKLTQKEKKALIREQRARAVQQAKNGTGDEPSANKTSNAVPAASSVKQTLPIKCLVCSEEFESKNRLFDHIKVTKHAALKPMPPVKKSKPVKRAGKKK